MEYQSNQIAILCTKGVDQGEKYLENDSVSYCLFTKHAPKSTNYNVV